MNRIVKVAGIVGAPLFAAFAFFLPVSGVAYAGEGAHVVAGAACEHAGATGANKKGVAYRCEQRRGEDCPHWHWVYNPATPTGTRSAWPVGPCGQCTPPVTTPPATVPP